MLNRPSFFKISKQNASLFKFLKRDLILGFSAELPRHYPYPTERYHQATHKKINNGAYADLVIFSLMMYGLSKKKNLKNSEKDLETALNDLYLRPKERDAIRKALTDHNQKYVTANSTPEKAREWIVKTLYDLSSQDENLKELAVLIAERNHAYYPKRPSLR